MERISLNMYVCGTLNVPSMSNTMPLSGGAVLKRENSAVARKGANLLGPGEAMADRSRRRMKAASVSIGQQEEGKRLSEMDRRERAERPE